MTYELRRQREETYYLFNAQEVYELVLEAEEARLEDLWFMRDDGDIFLQTAAMKNRVDPLEVIVSQETNWEGEAGVPMVEPLALRNSALRALVEFSKKTEVEYDDDTCRLEVVLDADDFFRLAFMERESTTAPERVKKIYAFSFDY